MVDRLRKTVPRQSVARGDQYYDQGRVKRIEHDAGEIVADVQGSRLYPVRLLVDDEELVVECSCPWFTSSSDVCKHVWASVRAADAKNWLPDRELSFTIDDASDEDGWFYDERARALLSQYRGTAQKSAAPREPRPLWQRFLESLPAVPARSKAATAPEEIAYVIYNYPRATMLALELLGRTHKKNGEWGKWKSLALNAEQLDVLPPFDRESLALLHRPYASTFERMIAIAPAAVAWWVERLARAGRLAVRVDDGELMPIAWDDGEPWTLDVSVTSDTNAARYRIAASVTRGSESMPLEDVETVIGGILFTHGRAHRLDERGRSAWLHALRASGPIDVPHADAERFRDALLRAPSVNISLPEELGWNLVDAEPKPVLALAHDAWSSELHGDLLFQYDDWSVSSKSRETQKSDGRKVIRRNAALEQAHRDRLLRAGAISAWDGYRVRQPQLELLVRSLSAEGWKVEIESLPVRIASDIEVEISSGIDWFDLDVSASFGSGGTLELPELLAATGSLLQLSDGSYGILPANWDEALAPLLELGKREGASVRFRPSQALLVDTLLQSKPKADAKFLELREQMTAAAPAPRQEPPTLGTELRPYQRAGLGWLHFLRESRLGGCLADDMGLGKTVQALALLEGLRASGASVRSLVVAPRSLLFNWAAEAKRFAPSLRVVEHHGPQRDLAAIEDCDLVLTTYATMRLEIEDLSKIAFEYVILDEAQAIKNATSQVAKATRLLDARHRLALSGTPIENHLGELWSLFEFLNPGLLGSSRSFSRTFAGKTVPPERREALARALRPLILRRTKEQVAPELPERIEQTLFCELEGNQKKQYDELRDHYRKSLLGRIRKGGIEKSRMHILEALLRLRQAACAPALIDGNSDSNSAKLELLMSELRDVVEAGHRALVFSQFTSFLALVRRELDDARLDHLYLDGKTRDRQSLVEEFQSGDGPPLFLISLKAGGLGLNLTNADYIFLLDPWWNPAVEAQAIDRAHRIGRQKPVVAYRLIARDTVEEKILELQARKRELAESIISQDNSVLRKIEIEDLELLLG